ncbi:MULTISPECIES: hypothetical protein [Bacillaceae]|uniref:hypothetical protein n=1 Tax=Bacillaceae TaxID=186817 RepID=UPI000BED2A1B|nr:MULTISPECIES: hypothetical protein [unclassified Bacillus (in: firmicutes)]PEC50503.1 hypothetical protein CON00_06105 [Bacillus sp. AFS096315]PFM81964.1 hypothetical protein COJ46_07805 [Bacillus sp. AFS077874]
MTYFLKIGQAIENKKTTFLVSNSQKFLSNKTTLFAVSLNIDGGSFTDVNFDQKIDGGNFTDTPLGNIDGGNF